MNVPWIKLVSRKLCMQDAKNTCWHMSDIGYVGSFLFPSASHCIYYASFISMPFTTFLSFNFLDRSSSLEAETYKHLSQLSSLFPILFISWSHYHLLIQEKKKHYTNLRILVAEWISNNDISNRKDIKKYWSCCKNLVALLWNSENGPQQKRLRIFHGWFRWGW